MQISINKVLRVILITLAFFILWSISFVLGKYSYINTKSYVAEWDIWYLETYKKNNELKRYIKEIEDGK